MTIEQATEQAILEYAPYYRQTNAALTGEYAEYVGIVIQLYRDWHSMLVSEGATEWRDMPAEQKQYIIDNKPY